MTALLPGTLLGSEGVSSCRQEQAGPTEREGLGARQGWPTPVGATQRLSLGKGMSGESVHDGGFALCSAPQNGERRPSHWRLDRNGKKPSDCHFSFHQPSPGPEGLLRAACFPLTPSCLFCAPCCPWRGPVPGGRMGSVSLPAAVVLVHRSLSAGTRDYGGLWVLSRSAIHHGVAARHRAGEQVGRGPRRARARRTRGPLERDR